MEPTQEYYEAKAKLCEKVAIKQILEGNNSEGIRNLQRMVFAMEKARMSDGRAD